MADMREALKGLVEKLDAIHKNARYQAVWECAQFSMGPYTGPDYAKELEQARAALAAPGEPVACTDCKGEGIKFDTNGDPDLCPTCSPRSPGEPVAWLADAAQPALRRDDLVEGGFTDAEIYPLYRAASPRALDVEEVARIIGGDIFGTPDSEVGPATLHARLRAREKAAEIAALAKGSK